MWPFKRQKQEKQTCPTFIDPRFRVRYDMDHGYYSGGSPFCSQDYFETEWELIESIYLKGAKAHYQYLINKRMNP